MLKNILRISAAVLLVSVVAASAVTLNATYSGGWYRCMFPSCATAPPYRVLCKSPMNGPIYVRYLNQCCCGGDNWQNLFRFIY